MRLQDAPPPGWYPDPEGSARLRYWEGTDWTDRFRARPPSSAVQQVQEATAARLAGQVTPSHAQQTNAQMNAQAVVDQVRVAAREEAERAAQLFGAQARAATRNITPLITEYTSKFTRWFRILSVVVIVLLVAWVAFQIFAQVSLFEWIGERIDNITDNGGAPVSRG